VPCTFTEYSLAQATAHAHAGLWLQWRGFGPGSHIRRPEPGGPLQHYDHCMPLQWPPKTLQALRKKGLPPDAGQAATIARYGKTIANTFWVQQASTAHGFMYKCASNLLCFVACDCSCASRRTCERSLGCVSRRAPAEEAMLLHPAQYVRWQVKNDVVELQDGLSKDCSAKE
jgi:hypothetical protein